LRLGLFDDDQRDHQVNAKHRRRSFHNFGSCTIRSSVPTISAAITAG
jgi:hypothetical protein